MVLLVIVDAGDGVAGGDGVSGDAGDGVAGGDGDDDVILVVIVDASGAVNVCWR